FIQHQKSLPAQVFSLLPLFEFTSYSSCHLFSLNHVLPCAIYLRSVFSFFIYLFFFFLSFIISLFIFLFFYSLFFFVILLFFLPLYACLSSLALPEFPHLLLHTSILSCTWQMLSSYPLFYDSPSIYSQIYPSTFYHR